jgi:hypothetical protein
MRGKEANAVGSSGAACLSAGSRLLSACTKYIICVHYSHVGTQLTSLVLSFKQQCVFGLMHPLVHQKHIAWTAEVPSGDLCSQAGSYTQLQLIMCLQLL